jgi:hypothetical protein
LRRFKLEDGDGDKAVLNESYTIEVSKLNFGV